MYSNQEIQKTCTSDKHNSINGGPSSNLILVDVFITNLIKLKILKDTSFKDVYMIKRR